ncbi:hypothetical protein [Amphritea sp.]|uniref:hypothetical protein n=1 Tax=Amphritea sp. TaxID=1872502 RepID=UPI003566905A
MSTMCCGLRHASGENGSDVAREAVRHAGGDERVDDFGVRLIWDTRNYTSPRRYEVNFSWGAASPYENQPISPVDPGLSLAHNVPAFVDEGRSVVWGDGSWTRPTPDCAYSPGWTAEPEEEAPRPVQPDIRGVYIFMPVLTLYRPPPTGLKFQRLTLTGAPMPTHGAGASA